MSNDSRLQQQTLVDPHDREHVESQTDPRLRDTMMAAIVQHRRSDRLGIGDHVPSLPLTRLDQLSTIRLDELIGDKPLVLIFGSYT